MRKLITVICIFCLTIGCSKEDLSCSEKREQINTQYSIAVSREGISTEAKEELYAQWQRELKEACN